MAQIYGTDTSEFGKRGTEGDDYFEMRGGDDGALGLGGNDAMYGGSGNDNLSGGPGDDALFGDDGIDHLSGDEGDDKLFAGTGSSVMYGGSGSDRLVGNSGRDLLSGGGLNVFFEQEPGDFDFLSGKGGNDILNLNGDGSADGGGGYDAFNVDLRTATAGVTFTAGAKGDGTLTGAANISFQNMEVYSVFSGSGNDRIVTGDRADIADTGTGRDRVVLGDGKDEATTALGKKKDFDGGRGKDHLEPTYDGSKDITVMRKSGTLEDNFGSSFRSFESVFIEGGDGNDRLEALNGSQDRLFGNGGRDVLDGWKGRDLLFGGQGKDKIFGGKGNDDIYGGAGRDVLRGGSGADSFVFHSNDPMGDRIKDFDTAKDVLTIDFDAIDRALTFGDDVVVSRNEMSNASAQFVYSYNKKKDMTVLTFHADADSRDLVAKMDGKIDLTADHIELVGSTFFF